MRNQKKALAISASVISLFLLGGCVNSNSAENPSVAVSDAHEMIGVIAEINGNHITVERPDNDNSTNNLYQFDSENLPELPNVEVGLVVLLTYEGMIIDTLPAQINVVDWELFTATQN